ncbi:MAG: Fe(3+) dicitrate transport protein [Candidatus Azotimanducaceae bacterium]|jgi:Fe(3+) dicitrate transport protein
MKFFLPNFPILACTSLPIISFPGKSLVSAVFLLIATSSVLAAKTSEAQERREKNGFIEEVTIVGDRQTGNQVAGSAHYVSAEQIERLGHTDIQRIIRQIPGVSIQVEDGYGLRPNISIRGVATERSGRITLLEDNVLIAPAPYSAPSAYYFPTAGRMSAVEVLKGPAAITQGPYTIGGALNMISTPIPEQAGGRMIAEGGEDSTYRVHGYYGGTNDQGFGFLLETHQWRSDGFQNVDRGGDSGLNVKDYTAKLSYAPVDSNHSVELKLQFAEQNSDQSYLGLTDGDFSNDAYRRYGLSTLDNIETEHKQVILRYEWEINKDISFDATFYNNEHARDWFKTEGLDADGSADAGDFSRTSWFSIIQAVNTGGVVSGLTAGQLQQVLDGSIDTAPGSIQLRSNAREYYSRGVQLGLDWNWTQGDWAHNFEIGVRLHEDEEDRLQRNSNYQQVSGSLVLNDLGLLGNAGNRIQEAEALAVHIYDRIVFGAWTLTPGLRFEDIKQARTRYETRSSRTATPASRDLANLRDQRSNDTKVLLPGMGVLYKVSDRTSFFGGVHKGFTAPSNSPGVEEEVAINYELGVRFTDNNLRAEATYFHSDYDNLLGVCTGSSGSDCEIGDAFNGDAATVQGIEMMVGASLFTTAVFEVPVELAYTFIDSEFDTNIADTDFFGDVSEGDPIPYIPENQLNLTVGMVASKWNAFLAINYIGDTCVRASCGAFEKTDSALTADISANYQASDTVELFFRIENLTGSEDILGRQPYGARPNKDRTASLGARIAI